MQAREEEEEEEKEKRKRMEGEGKLGNKVETLIYKKKKKKKKKIDVINLTEIIDKTAFINFFFLILFIFPSSINKKKLIMVFNLTSLI